MKRLISQTISILLLFTVLSGCDQQQDTEITTILLVRHAEEVKDRYNDNPELKQEGLERAQTLAIVLKDEPINTIYAAKSLRATQTVEPASLSHNLETLSFPQNDLGIIDQILQFHKGEKILMATDLEHIPQILNLLEGEPTYEAEPNYKYDYLYVISIVKKGKISVTTLRYGDG